MSSAVSTRARMPQEDPLARPSVARMYDYYLGGGHNFAVDRQAGDQAMTIYPDFPLVMQVNRAFLRRAVSYLVEQGIDQFLDIGSGIPTVGNVHEVAQRANPAARIVYVDIDQVAVAHSRALLRGNSLATVVQADARRPQEVLGHPDVRRLLDSGRPMAIMVVALLHFVPDDGEAHGLVRALRDAMPSGSYLALTHATKEHAPATAREQLERLYAGASSPLRFRSGVEIATFFEGLELVDPGLVSAPLWRSEGRNDLFFDQPERAIQYVGVGRKA
ncbi:MAG: SAM-dependent methyltransferase [Chloroflexota bacterium]|nr:SAM-dependent methyltransferase [Chloroflexota bacterium]